MRARDLMQCDATIDDGPFVPPDASVEDVAQVMVGERVHRVVVGEPGRPQGSITALDVLRALLEGPDPRSVRRSGYSR
jgi:CBS domain-containing protein